MSMWLERFGTLALPLIEAQQDIGAVGTRTAYTNLPGGGAYDAYGTGVAPRGLSSLSASGEIGNLATQAEMLVEFDALRAKRGRLDKLYARMDDTTIRWVWARLRTVAARRRPEHVLYLPIDLQFDVLSPVWNGATHGTDWFFDDGHFLDTGLMFNQAFGDAFTLDWDGFNVVNVVNGGNAPIDNAVITITAGASAVTEFSVESIGPAGDDQANWSYTGSLGAGDVLVIDAGAQSITNDGADAYADFTIDADHMLSGWFRLDPGTTELTIAYTSTTDASMVLTFSEGWE